MKLQLLHFSGCPTVERARAAVRDAIAAEHLDLAIEEIDVEDPAAPTWTRGWGSPTVLIDGEDVSGQPAPVLLQASSCRLYAGGAPSVDVIRSRLRRARDGGKP